MLGQYQRHVVTGGDLGDKILNMKHVSSAYAVLNAPLACS